MFVTALSLTLLGLACLLGLLLIVVQMPGIWLIVAAALLFGWHEHFSRFSPRFIALIASLAIAAELLELLPSLFLARRAGASRRAAWLGLIGGMVGMFALSIPVPILGTIVGGVLGCFAGAVLGELTIHDNLDRAAKVGIASAIGRVIGLVMKLSIAIVMSGLCFYEAIH